jgi:hypothetical protein
MNFGGGGGGEKKKSCELTFCLFMYFSNIEFVALNTFT